MGIRLHTDCDKMISLRNMVLALAILSCLTCVMCGCGSRVRAKVEKSIAKALQKRLGPAKEYSVKVSGSTMSIIKGKIDAVDISGRDVKLAKGITVAQLHVTIKDLVVDPSTQEIKKCHSTTYSALVTQDELQRYLTERYPEIPGLSVVLLDREARVTATPGVAGVTVTINADAALIVNNGTQVVLDLKKINVGWLPTPGFAREYIEKRINPVFDAADLGFDARINSVTISPGAVTITGTLDLVKAFSSPSSSERTTPEGIGQPNL